MQAAAKDLREVPKLKALHHPGQSPDTELADVRTDSVYTMNLTAVGSDIRRCGNPAIGEEITLFSCAFAHALAALLYCSLGALA